MKIKSILIIFNLLFILNQPVSASTILQCIGIEYSGKTMNVILDVDAQKLHVNGDIFKITNYIPRKSNKKYSVLSTENFISSQGTYLYDVFGLTNDHSKTAVIAQFNAITNKIVTYANLTCHLIN